jgi:hypothetical protein
MLESPPFMAGECQVLTIQPTFTTIFGVAAYARRGAYRTKRQGKRTERFTLAKITKIGVDIAKLSLGAR